MTTLCRMLGVSASGFYAWDDRPLSARAQADAALLKQIQTIFTRSRRTYGAPRVHAELWALSVRCGRKRVARLMRAAGLVGAHRRRSPRTTWRDRDAVLASDLVQRQFETPAPNRLWVADITYVRTGAGWLYLAVVLDVFSRRVVGWAMNSLLETTLVLDALNMALWNRRPAPGVVHHSIAASSTQAWPTAVGVRKRAWCPRWAVPVMRMITRLRKRSSPRSRRSCSCGTASSTVVRRAGRCSTTSRAGTTRTAATRPWSTARRRSSKGTGGHTQKSPELFVYQIPVSRRYRSSSLSRASRRGVNDRVRGARHRRVDARRLSSNTERSESGDGQKESRQFG